MKISTKIIEELTTIITALDAEKATCLWNNLILSKIFQDALKESDTSILDDLTSLTNEEEALTQDSVMSDGDMRQMLISCMDKMEPIVKTVGIESSEC